MRLRQFLGKADTDSNIFANF